MTHKNKSRLLYTLKLLTETTDASNPVSIVKIIKYLKSLGISAHRKTVADDMEMLLEFGIDVVTIKSTQNRYFIGSRDFELAEVKLLVDAVEASKFITARKSEELVRKLSTLVSFNQANELNRHIYIDKRVKPENEDIYYIVDNIHQAIAQNKQITFKYYEYNQNKKKVYKNRGFIYSLSPYSLSWNDDHYYVIGYCDKHGKISTFRADRIAKLAISEIAVVPMPDGFNAADYAKNIFEMFDGETTVVELKCANTLMKVIIDKFGEKVDTKPIDKDFFKATVEVSVSPTFYGWVFQFDGNVSIIFPDKTKMDYKDMVSRALD